MAASNGMKVIHCWTVSHCGNRWWSISMRIWAMRIWAMRIWAMRIWAMRAEPLLPRWLSLGLAFALSLGSTLAVSQSAHAEELKPFEASYTWVWHGMTVAVSTLKLERLQQGKDTWMYASK